MAKEINEEKAKLYDVFDGAGNLLNIYKDKKTADEFAAKVSARKVVPSPNDRTREDVKEAINKMKAVRLKALAESSPGIYKA